MPEDESGEFAGRYWRSQAKIDEDLPRLTSSSIDDVTFRHLADHIPTLCWVANGDGFIVWYNRRWHEYCGSKAQDMEGWGWMAVHDPDSLAAVLERWTSALSEGQPFEMTFPLKGADGRFRPFLTRIQPVRDASGEVVRWFGVNTEISAQVAAEDALRIERDRSRGILENISDGFLVLDDAFVVRQISAEGLRIDGRAAGDIIGRSHWDVYPGTEAGELGRLYKSALAEGTPVALDHQYVWPDGHRTWFEMRAYPTPDRKFLGIFYRDVTDRIKSELALRASEEQFRIFAQSMPNHVWSACSQAWGRPSPYRRRVRDALCGDDLLGGVFGGVAECKAGTQSRRDRRTSGDDRSPCRARGLHDHAEAIHAGLGVGVDEAVDGDRLRGDGGRFRHGAGLTVRRRR